MHDQGVLFLLQEPEKFIGVTMNAVYTGCSLSRKGDGWLLVVRIRTKEGQNLVCFIHSPSSYTCWEYLYDHLTKRNAPLKWRVDAYAKS